MFSVNSLLNVLDCTLPFRVDIKTDSLSEKATSTDPNDAENERGRGQNKKETRYILNLHFITGVCLEYVQIPCG